MPDWCSKHNREMLPSKFGGLWCPDCSKEKKQQKGLQPDTADKKHEEIMNALREIYKEMAGIKNEFKSFAKIFGEQNKEE